MDNNNSSKLSEELINRHLEFKDDTGKVIFKFVSNKLYIGCGEYTDWKDIKLERLYNSKFHDMLNIHNDIYNGDKREYKNMESILFKMKIKIGCIDSCQYKYIIMIVKNPSYKETQPYYSNNGKYKLIVYIVNNKNIFSTSLIEIETLTSTI